MQQRRVRDSHYDSTFAFGGATTQNIPSLALPNGDTSKKFWTSMLNELYLEIRKRKEFFLYILFVGTKFGATGTALGIHF